MLHDQLEAFNRTLSGRRYPHPVPLNHVRFWLLDKNSMVDFSLRAQKNWLKVDNADGSEFAFIRIDGTDSVFGSSPPPVENDDRFAYDDLGTRAGSCDCLIIDNHIWHFIEFKTNSTSEELEQIQLNRIKAEMQLARTLYFFGRNDPSFNSTCKAILVVPIQYGYPRFRSNQASRAVKFKLKWKVPLEEVNLKDGYKINT